MLHPSENKNFYGHPEQIATLEKFIESGRIPHAYLFTGAKGVGKATLAYHFAKALLNLNSESTQKPEEEKEVDSFDLFGGGLLPEEPKPEQKSNSSKISIINHNSKHAEKVERGVHPDLLIIDSDVIEKGEIKIEEVRKIKDFITLTPSESTSRVVIIDSADYLNTNAANAILKVLEEPTKNTFLILISHKPAFILPTIKSRCRELKFKGLEQQYLDKIIKDNIKIKSDDTEKLEKLEYAKKISGNSAGLTIFFYKNDAFDIYQELQNNLNYLPKFSYIKAKKLTTLASSSKEAWQVFENVFINSFYDYVKSINVNQANDNQEKTFDKYSQISTIFRDTVNLNYDKGDSIRKIISIINS
jgi:DNA polymerase-3 subunit delta'